MTTAQRATPTASPARGDNSAERNSAWRTRASTIVPQLLTPLVVLAIWELTARWSSIRFYVPASEAFSKLFDSLGDSRFLDSVRYTLTGVSIAFAVCAVAATLLGILLGLRPYAAEVVSPLLYGINSLPKVTLYPIFLLVFGLDMDGRVAFAIFHGIFAGTIIIMEATLAVSPVYLKVATSLRMSFLQTFRHIVVPSITPTLVSALRLMFGLCFIGMVVAELFSSYIGLGHELMRYIQLVQPDRAFGLVILIFAVVIVPTLLMIRLERGVRQRYAAD